MRVLITSSRTPHALAAIRSFGKKGWEVTAGDSTRLSAGGFSKYASHRLIYPSMTEKPQKFLEAILEEVSKTKYDLLFPTFEEIFLFARFQDIFSKFTTLLLSDYKLFMKLHHKMSLNTICEKLNISVPPTWQPHDFDHLEKLADEIPLPAIIKLPDVNNSLGLTLVDTKEEMIKGYKKLVKFFDLKGDRMPMIQKRIDGELLFSLFIANKGETTGSLIYKPITMFPDTGGTAFYRESVRNDVAEKQGMELIKELGWHGFIGFDYILDSADNTPYLIDANPRPNPAFQTGEAAGVDFTQMAADIAQNLIPQKNLDPKPGVKSKTLFVEIIWFVFQLMPGKSWGSRVKKAFSVFRKREFVPDVHRKDDRLPSFILYLFVNYFLFIVNAVKPKSGGFMFGCNYTLDTEKKVDPEQITKKA